MKKSFAAEKDFPALVHELSKLYTEQEKPFYANTESSELNARVKKLEARISQICREEPPVEFPSFDFDE